MTISYATKQFVTLLKVKANTADRRWKEVVFQYINCIAHESTRQLHKEYAVNFAADQYRQRKLQEKTTCLNSLYTAHINIMLNIHTSMAIDGHVHIMETGKLTQASYLTLWDKVVILEYRMNHPHSILKILNCSPPILCQLPISNFREFQAHFSTCLF